MSSSAKRPLPSRNDTITLSFRDLVVYTFAVMASTAIMSVLLTLANVSIAQNDNQPHEEVSH